MRLFFKSKSLTQSFIRSFSKTNLISQKHHVKTNELKIPTPWGHLSGQLFGDLIDKDTNQPNKPILALHGYLDNSNSFKPLASHICSNGYYMIALDFPGHGFSSHIPNGMHYSPKLFLVAVRAAVKHLELKKFNIVAHSFGSSVSLLVS